MCSSLQDLTLLRIKIKNKITFLYEYVFEILKKKHLKIENFWFKTFFIFNQIDEITEPGIFFWFI